MTPRAFKYKGPYREPGPTVFICDTHTCCFVNWDDVNKKWRIGDFQYARDDLSEEVWFKEIGWLEVLLRTGQSKEKCVAALKWGIRRFKKRKRMKLRDLLEMLSQYDPDKTEVVIEDLKDETTDIDFVHSTGSVVFLGVNETFKE